MCVIKNIIHLQCYDQKGYDYLQNIQNQVSYNDIIPLVLNVLFFTMKIIKQLQFGILDTKGSTII